MIESGHKVEELRVIQKVHGVCSVMKTHLSDKYNGI